MKGLVRDDADDSKRLRGRGLAGFPAFLMYLSTMNAAGAFGYGRECQPLDRLEPASDLPFEGLRVRVPGAWRSYLTQVYGDWEALPPPARRHPRHGDLRRCRSRRHPRPGGLRRGTGHGATLVPAIFVGAGHGA